jgi:DNA-binding response OmpR family regulator
MNPETNAERVLIVDDDTAMVALIRGWVETLGLITDSAANGAEALEVARRFLPDLIVMDAMMPVMGGFEALTALKKDPLLQDIPVLFLTVRDDVQDIVAALDMGASNYLRKPFKPQEFLARLKSILRQKRDYDLIRHEADEAKCERDRLASWLDQLSAGFMRLDVSGQVLSWRGPILSEDELRGRPATEILECQGAIPWQEEALYDGPALVLAGSRRLQGRALGRPVQGGYELLLIPS